MAKRKYYAVRIGKVKGIYETWEACKSNVEGISGAEYKSFSTKEEAEAYFNGQEISIDQGENPWKQNNIGRAYVDGSFSEAVNRYAFGAVLISPDGEIEEICGFDDKAEALVSRNVAGELVGAMKAILWAGKNQYKKLVIYHDYEGIRKWALGEWKAKSYVAIKYLEFLKKHREKIDIEFVKVLAHSGDKYNELADELAKKGLLLEAKNTELV